MSEKEKAAAVAQEAEVVIPLRSELPTPAITFDGPWGTIAVIGANHVSPAFMNVIGQILTAWDEFHLTAGTAPMHHGIHSIVLRDDDNPRNDEGKAIFGHALATVGSMAINLEHIFQKSIEDSIDTPQVSIYCNIWHHSIITILHEMHHLAALYNDPALTLEDEEELANKFSMDFSYFLAQNYPIEPGALAEEPFFGSKMLETIQSFMVEAGEEDTAFWKDQQMKALEGIMYWTKIGEDKEEDRIIKSFREFMHWTSGEESDDAKWAKLYAEAEPVATEADIEAAKARQKLTEATGDPNWSPPAIDLTQPIPASPTIEINAYTGEESEVHEIDPYVEMAMDDMGVYETPNQVLNTLAVNSPVLNAAGWTPPAAAAPAPAAPAPTLMPNSSGMAHGLSPAEIGECCMLVYRRLFNHMFTACEPVIIDNTTIRPDGQGGGCGGFKLMEALQTPIPISDIPNADKVFVQQDSKINGKWTKGIAISGSVIGSDTGNKTMLPKYDLYIINDQGHMEKRTLLPQNPWKTKQTDAGLAFTKPAAEAQSGKRIMYIYSQNTMKLKVLAEQDASGNWREWLEDANWNVIG